MSELNVNSDAFKWIEDFFPQKADRTIYVKTVVPDVFDKYIVIENNYGIIDDFPFDEYPADTDSIHNLNKRHAIEREFGLFLKRDTEHLYRPITIKEIAEKFNVPYSRHTIDYIPDTAGVGIMSRISDENYKKLVHKLITSECYLFSYDPYFGINDHDIKALKIGIPPKAIINNATEYISLLGKLCNRDSYLFPASRNWCLITYEWVHNVILACNNEVADKIRGNHELELFEVRYNEVIGS